MDDRTISNLQTHIVNVPGGRDKEERCVIAVHVPQQCNNLDVSSTLTYIISIFSNETARRGFTVILDARKCPWRVARSCIRQVNAAFPTGELAQFIVLRPDAFWDKQRVESCRNAQKDGQVIFIPLSRLFKYVERPQLPIELGGNFIFNSNQWFENRMKVEEFYEESEKCSIDLKELQESISNIYTLKASQIQNNHQLLLERLDVLKIVANNCIDKGSKLIEKIEYDNRNRKFESESESMATPQDIADTIDKLETIVGSMRKQLINLDNLKNSMRKSFANTKDLLFLEEGVQFVVNWVLGPAEDMFKRNLKVGYDLASAEELRRAHERIELECWNAYGAYAELLFKIESFANETMLSQQQKDLISQKDFMDFVCRSFANRLERRRNILITSLRFFRLVSEYFDKTGDVFDAVVVKNEMSNFATAEVELKKLFECQRALDVVERELFKEGEKLSDMLSMPVKDALGREILANYSDDIGNIRDIMDATTARKNILSDSVELQKLTLEQTTIIHQFESDAVQAIQWLDELFHGLLKYHGHVGCTVYEIQAQKIDHQTYLETARCSYNYGMQLIQAAAALRDSCKLPQTDNKDVMQNLHFAWDKFLKISQEQMTRLRVCAVFHRSVEEQCNQMRNLREAIATISLVEAAKRCQRVKQYCAVRERLLVDVGRMVRLGRLLRSRLKEPLYSIDRMSESVSDLEKIEITEPTDNETAVEAIGERLVEITDLAEELDQTLKSAQQDAMISSTATSLPIPIGRSDKYHSQDNLGSLSPRNIRSDDGKSDEEFLTASDCTLHHSRSSSYNTASDSEHLSQWWEYGKDDMHDDIAKEKMVLAVGLPDLPLAKTVLKPSPDVPRGKIAREVTETTHIKVQHTHAFDVKSFVLTSETVRNTQDIKCGGDVSVKTEVSKVSDLRPSDEDNEQLQYLKKLQECGEWLQLKILEVTPELTALGDTLEEALQLQQAHNAVLHQIQNKQSPVDELLRQADQLISTQKPRAEVYAAMAESLGRAWNDINGHLENRKILLDLNVQYHTRAQEFFDSMSALEAACSDTLVPIEIESVKTLLNNIHELRRTVLESLMAAMQAGNMIIGNLKELEAEGTLDSRPDRIRLSAKKALTQVQEWMERLHYRRQALETIFTQRKIQLEQCLALAMLSFDLRQLQDTIAQRKDTLTASDQLGDSVSSAELLKRELEKLIAEGHMLQDKALKITKTTEHLLESGCLAGEQAKRNAYDVLSSTSDYISELQHRDALFEKVIRFFKTAQSAFSQLDLIDMQLKNNELPATSPQLAQLHERCIHAVEEITASLISEGYALLADIGTEMNASGVRNVLEELERRKIHFDGVCVAHKEENKKIARALTNFFERQDELSDWLIKVAETFLREHYDMGNSLADARDFLGLHNQLLNDLQTKGNEINTLLLTLPPILEYLDDHQRLQVEMKVEALHERWLNLKNVLEARLDWAVLYVKFHTEADKVENEMNNIDQIITDHEDLSEEAEKAIENRIGELVPLYQSAKNTGATFINEAKKVTEPPHLNIKAAFGCVESVLDRLGSRQITLQRNWQTVLTRCVEKREVEVLIKENMEESTKTINWMSKMDTQLYPIITTNETDPKIVAQHIENKLNDVLTQIRNAESEIEQRMRVADTIIQRSPNDQTFLIKQKLLNMKQNLKMICTDYQTLMQMMVSYFNNIDKIDLIVTEYFESFDAGKSLEFYPNIDLLLREFENRKQSIHNQFNMAKREKETIIDKINKQEPKDVAQQDIEKLHYLLQIREEEFTKVYREAKDNIEAQKKIHVFETDLHQINVTLDELNKKLDVVKGQYGQSLSAAEDTSLSFVYFEETVKLLEPKISEFIETGANMLQNQEALQSQKIKEQINNLQQRWDALKTRIRELRNLINLSVQYFTLIDNANKWFQEGNILLSSIATRSTMVKQPEDAQVLLNEIELFLKPGESKQSQRIEEIIELATRLFGDELSHEIPHESQIMMESYNLITQELNGLWTKIKNIETAKAAVVEPEQSVVIEEIHEVPDVVESPTLEVPVFTSPLNDQLIEEGSTFTFVCRVTGNPVPVVTWHKDGISIQNNPDYQTLFDQGLCSLTIDETFNEDSARYTCRAINAAGAAETEAYLTVKENLPEEQLIPPHFIKELQPGLINENESFEFVCKLEGNPLPTVQWYKNLNCIDNSSYYSITYNNGEARLLISKVHLDDKADYTCKAYNEVGIAQSTANLNVTSLEPTRMPAFITPLSNIMARAGQKIKLECEVTGLPTPKLNWSKDGKPLTETHELKLHFDGSKATLIIHEAFPKDAGTYTASASNLVGEVSSVSTITVKGRLPPETSDSELASDMEPIKPSIQVPLKDVSINEGNRVRLDCVIVGQPEPEVIWYHDDRPVQESSDFQLLFQGDRCSLVIKEALLEDAGEYKVVALNSAGEASSKAALIVTPNADKVKASDDKFEAVGSAPKFSKLLSDILVSENDTVILEATVSGDPKPEIKWLLNNAAIEADAHINISQDENGNLKLLIEHVKPEDRGVYTVKASNHAGEAKCFAQLIVKTLRSHETSKVHEEAKIKPSFRESFKDKAVVEGTAIKFECIVTGKPTPKIRWLFNDTPVAGKDFLISTSGNREVLSINEVTKDHIGKITCVAENEAGQETCSANLEIQPSQDIALPQDLIVSNLISGQGVTMKREVNIQSSSSTTSHIFSSTTGMAPHVEEHKYSSQDAKYFKQINQNAPEVKESSRQEEYHKIGDQPPVVHEKVTSVDIVSAIESSVPKSIFKARPPKFVTPVIGKIVDQDANVVLEGILDASPTPEVTWTKNGNELQSGNNVTVTFKHNSARVELKDVAISDAGRYTCTAVNEAGKAISTADLVVRKTIFPPVFGRRLQAQVISKGQRAIMEVEISGTPDPEITWFKDGQPIKTDAGSDYKLIAQGNCQRLILEKAEAKHTGKYMVCAVNPGGEAQSIADIAVFDPTPDTMVEVVKTVVYEDVRKHETMSSEAGSNIQQSTDQSTLQKPIPITDSFQSPPETIESLTTEVSRHIEDTITHDTKTFTLERTTPVPTIDMPKRVEHKEVEFTEPPVEIDEGIQTSSITKQQSLNYFVNKMKEVDEYKPKETPKPIQIKQDIYTKFEELGEHKMTGSNVEPLLQPTAPIITHDTQYTSFTSNQANLYDEFNLTPEPPPEICYTTKPESVKLHEDVTDRVKKIEKLQRDLPEGEIPLGAVKIFPDVQAMKQTTHEETSKSFSQTFKSESAMFYKAEAIGPITKPMSPIPPMEFETIPDYKKQAMAEAIAMEKEWAHKKPESNVQKAWPPLQPEPAVPKVAPTWTNQTVEKTVTPSTFETTTIKESTTPTTHTYIKETSTSSTFKHVPPPLEVPHYVAHVSTSSKSTEIQEESSFVKQQEYKYEQNQNLKQFQSTKATTWQPPLETLPCRPISVQDITDEFVLEPGTPPEIVYAPPLTPVQPPKVVERVVASQKVVEKVVAPVKKAPVVCPVVKTAKPVAPPKKVVEPVVTFEKFKELEPFPFKAEPERPRGPRMEVPTPSKFIKGKFTDSDYESDFDATRIPAKWKPHSSDTEDITYRPVAAPKAVFPSRPRSCERGPLAPSQFEQPQQVVTSPRPEINLVKQVKQVNKQTVQFRKSTEIQETKSKQTSMPLDIKQGSPPEYAYAEPKVKPQSPKTKQKVFTDGYQADTDEPFRQTIAYEQKHEQKSSYSSNVVSHHEHIVSVPTKSPAVTKVTSHKKHISASASSKKKLVSTPIVSVSTSAPLEPFPFKPDPPVQRVKVPPPPSPSKFVKGEFRESDYESDYDGRLSTSWHLGQEKHFKPVRPVLTPTLKPQRTERLPTPPNEFENPSKVEMPTKPKFEPIEKHKKSVKLEEIIKPIPKPTPTSKFIIRPPVTDIVPATPRVQEKIIILQPGTPPELVYTPGPKTTQYYRSTTSAPYHNAVQTETSNIMNFNESTENSHRTVSLQQTTKVIKFGESSKKSVTPVPSKFIPGDYRESDYESEVDSVKIQSKWTPTGKSGDSYYRRVKAPTFVRASSVPSSRDHVKTPMEYDTQPPFIPQATADKTVQISNMRGISQNITKQTASKIASEHMSNMTQTFKSKAHKFASDIMDDVNKTKVQKPILRSKDDSDAQVYREESRAAQYGTKHVDPNTGLIYFKYDFGYEFGIVLPGDGKPGEIPMPKKTIIQPPQRSESIEMPVYHETSKPEAVTPQFQPKKFKAPNKNVKWEPTSESEMSECETDRVKKQTWEQSSCSPISISPSLPSTSPAFNNYQGGLKDCEQQTNGNVNSQLPTKRAPVFITPLRDIAAVCGQIARFECIVQSDPPPTILWSKNSRLIENSQDYQVYFRNGVCRLTIPKTYPEDAGTYTCTATNQTGAVSTTATLQVPGERRSSYI